MGSQYSGLNSLKQNEYIKRLISEESIDENDPFWNQLLSFSNNLSFSKSNSKLLDETIALECQTFHQNNLKSGNYGSLIRVFSRRSTETQIMSENHLMTLQTSNALLIIRCFTKYIIEIENESALLEQLNARSDSSVSEFLSSSETEKIPDAPVSKPTWPSKLSNVDLLPYEDIESDSTSSNISKQGSTRQDTLYNLIADIVRLCIAVPVEQHTYQLHFEALNTLLVLLSVQMYTKTPTDESYIYYTFMNKIMSHVPEFVKTLLKNIIQQMPAPGNISPQAILNMASNDESSNQSSSSLISSVASGFWTVMTLGLASSSSVNKQPDKSANDAKQNLHTYLPEFSNDVYNNTSSSNPYDVQIDCSSRLLAWQSCHILLVLTNHCTNESLFNPFRLALFHFTDIHDTPTNISNLEPMMPWFNIDYTKLFQMFTFTLHNDQYTLLLYMLLHRNQHFKMFILSRINIDLLIIPLLKVVFSAPDRNSHHIYMALIILLILSEDDLFNKSIHNISIKRLGWYTERSLSEISLGGLLILVVIRTIQFNMTRMRDKYLHTNCLAALANMSAKFDDLHPYVCQRINSLFGLLTRKRSKIISQMNVEATTVSSNEPTGQDLMLDLSIIEELMRMVLEIINSALTNSIHHNSNLVYSILYHKAQYAQFRSHPTFQDVVQNIDLVITHFSAEIEHLEDKTIESIKAIIDIGVRQFSRDRFKKFPELKFKYVEEDNPEDFFVPYVWSLIYKCSNLYWVDHTTKPIFDNNSITPSTT